MPRGGEVGQQADVAVGEGRGGEVPVQQREAAGGVGPGREEVPDQGELGECLVGVEAGQVVLVEELREGVAVVLVDGFVARRGVLRGVVAVREAVVRFAPFLRECVPVGAGGGGAEAAGEGCGGGVEDVGGARLQGGGDGEAPVDDCAEDVGEEGFRGVSEDGRGGRHRTGIRLRVAVGTSMRGRYDVSR